MVKNGQQPPPKLTFGAVVYALLFVAWWATCFVLLLQGWGFWLLLPLALSLAIAVCTANRLPSVEDALEACAFIVLLVHIFLVLDTVRDDFGKARYKDVIVCSASVKDTPSIKTSSGTYQIDDGTYNFGGKDRYIQDFNVIAGAFNKHQGAKFRLTYHGWDTQYVTGAKLLPGAGQCG